MLYLRRLKKQTYVAFRQTEPWISKPMKKGFFYAFLFHFALLSLFQVSFDFHSPISRSIPPATVYVDLKSVQTTTPVSKTFYTPTTSPPLLKPMLSLPTPIEMPTSATLPLPLTPMDEKLEYEALDLDFDNDQD